MVDTQGAQTDPIRDNEAMLAKGKLIMRRLEEVYPQAPEGFLHHKDPFTLLIAVVLSAQSLDMKVNEITPHLFEVGGTPEKMRELGESKIREIIKQIGLAPQKAKNIAKLSEMICEQYDRQVPDTFEGLESLPGVGHKTASVVMMQAFNKPAFPVDTHIHRLACRWGCGDAKSVEKTEAALKMWFPDPSTWGKLHTRIILFGREHCPARKHDMDQCPICSFAATDEARTSNRGNLNKFVAPKSHKNPYSIRDVPKVDPADKDPAYSPVQSSLGPKKKATGKRRAVVKKDGTTVNAKGKSGIMKKTETPGEAQGDTSEAPAKRPRRAQKRSHLASSVSAVAEDRQADMEENMNTKKQPKRDGRRKKQLEDSKVANEPQVQANGEVRRRSARVQARKAIEESN